MIRHIMSKYKKYFVATFLVVAVLFINILIEPYIGGLSVGYFNLLIFLITGLALFYGGTIYYRALLFKKSFEWEFAAIFSVYFVNNVIAVGAVLSDLQPMHMGVLYTLSVAQMIFAFGVFVTYGEQDGILKLNWLRKYSLPVVLLLGMFEVLLWFVTEWMHLDMSGIISLIHIMGTVFFVGTFVNDLANGAKIQHMIPLIYLMLAQAYLSVMPSDSVFLHIQSYWIMLTGIVLLLWLEIDEMRSHLTAQNEGLYRQFNIYSQNLRKLIDKKTLQVREANQSIINELEYARVVQQSLLPPRKYTYRDVIIMSDYYPCERLSGDFYDMMRIDDEFIALYYMDVAGHGISAALLTMLSNNFLRAQDHQIKRLWAQRPDKTLKLFYDHFNSLSMPEEMHLVIFYATYNLATKVLTYCSGGMNCAPLVFRRNGNYEVLDQSDGFPICNMGSVFSPVFASANILLHPGDRVIFYTDGLTDKEKNHIFSEEDLVEFCRLHRKKNPREFNMVLTEKIAPYKDELNDDITYIVMDI